MTAWISKITQILKAEVFSKIRLPLAPIPTPLLICELLKRPGLSAIALTSAIIQKCIERGLPLGNLPDGTPSPVLQFIRSISESIVIEIKENALVEMAGGPGAMNMTGTGANAGGPVMVQSTNLGFISLKGLMR